MYISVWFLYELPFIDACVSTRGKQQAQTLVQNSDVPHASKMDMDMALFVSFLEKCVSSDSSLSLHPLSSSSSHIPVPSESEFEEELELESHLESQVSRKLPGFNPRLIPSRNQVLAMNPAIPTEVFLRKSRCDPVAINLRSRREVVQRIRDILESSRRMAMETKNTRNKIRWEHFKHIKTPEDLLNMTIRAPDGTYVSVFQGMLMLYNLLE